MDFLYFLILLYFLVFALSSSFFILFSLFYSLYSILFTLFSLFYSLYSILHQLSFPISFCNKLSFTSYFNIILILC
ncbi:hypothetical protein B0A64_11490 [Flavobacterium araucananum]|uniref:ATP synthase subunit A n=1 Tax=Flavobacterium araucananum TaxID=946678 RepID=A0A227PA55_9FLAO|nr:hypothetical protein B0A64_11490 [Flavobacterium araucananum]